jgi:hypothetical protein
MRLLLLWALLLAGCAAPRQPNSTEALAEQKQRIRADREKKRELYNQQLRLVVRQHYLKTHPALSRAISKAILQERLKVGMTKWDVIAAYSLWEYTDDPEAAEYRESGVVALWSLVDRRQTTAPGAPQEEWTLQRQREIRRLQFENGMLTAWKD